MKQCVSVFVGCAIVVGSINGIASAADEPDRTSLDSTLTVAFSAWGVARDNIDHDLSKTSSIAYGFASYVIELRQAEYGYSYMGSDALCQSVPFVNCRPAVKETALLLGQRWQLGRKQSINLLAGPGYVRGDYRNRYISDPAPNHSYRTDHYKTVGIALETNYLISFSRYFGLGVALVANANTEQSFAGVYLNLYLGKLR